ncbi:hypothetical protein PanWU01x14_234030, partial [Parasponia andersonii]
LFHYKFLYLSSSPSIIFAYLSIFYSFPTIISLLSTCPPSPTPSVSPSTSPSPPPSPSILFPNPSPSLSLPSPSFPETPATVSCKYFNPCFTRYSCSQGP